DVGVGGRAGQVVGEKLWSISDRHQVVCITHLPQVAAFADAHYVITKVFSDGRTRTVVERLDDAQRAREIAAMLDGTPVSEHSLRSAIDMLERARAYKQRIERASSPEPSRVGAESAQ
ncbi:MAG: DNA repair protein RecN, partial [Roseiflexus castenholzii]